MAIGVRDRVLWQAAVALVALVVGVVVADAAAVVEVYRMIQYDLRGVPLGSRRAAMNHHASSNLAVPGSDLSRTVIILPIAEANITMLNGAYALASETSSAVVVSSFFFFSLSLSLSLSLFVASILGFIKLVAPPPSSTTVLGFMAILQKLLW
jgi:hypothetical protein